MTDPTPLPAAPDWRALCKELRDDLENVYLVMAVGAGGTQYIAPDVLLRADAALATPPAATREAGPVPQVGLTDEQLLELMPQQFRDDLATVSRLASYGTPVGPGLYRVSLNTGALAFARAVLARWGGAAVQPVAVSARLPEANDTIHPTGECWWFEPHADGAWYFDTYQGNYTHWLPHWALPVPAAAEGEGQP